MCFSLFIFPVCLVPHPPRLSFFFFFNDAATTDIYTLSLHDALPISASNTAARTGCPHMISSWLSACCGDRKSTRLNSSHGYRSYAVFCLKKKNRLNFLICFKKTKNKEEMNN